MALPIFFFLVTDYPPVPWIAARSSFLYFKGDTTVAKRHDRQVSSCFMWWLRLVAPRAPLSSMPTGMPH
jgi:hypothetical protein